MFPDEKWKRERKIFLLEAHSPNSHNSQCLTRLRPGAWNCMWIYHTQPFSDAFIGSEQGTESEVELIGDASVASCGTTTSAKRSNGIKALSKVDSPPQCGQASQGVEEINSSLFLPVCGCWKIHVLHRTRIWIRDSLGSCAFRPGSPQAAGDKFQKFWASMTTWTNSSQ